MGYRRVRGHEVEQIRYRYRLRRGCAIVQRVVQMWGDNAVAAGLQIEIPNTVKPGDEVSASVSLTGTTWTFTMNDVTQGWTSSNEAQAPCRRRSDVLPPKQSSSDQ